MEFIANVLQAVIGVVIAYYIIRRFTGSKDQIFNKKCKLPLKLSQVKGEFSIYNFFQ